MSKDQGKCDFSVHDPFTFFFLFIQVYNYTSNHSHFLKLNFEEEYFVELQMLTYALNHILIIA